MSTRGCIAKQKGDGFEGRYHHWDSYPEGLGDTLKEIYSTVFHGDLDKMLSVLIDEHPAGWSTINGADWTKQPGFDGSGPQCYCHGSRSEKANLLTNKTASACGAEYCYVFTPDSRMLTLSSYCEDGSKMIGFFGCGDPDAKWSIIGDDQLGATIPDEPSALLSLSGVQS